MTEIEVKQLVTQVFCKLGAREAAKVSETLFVDRGRRLATAYQTAGLQAVWCVEDGIVEFRSLDGRVLRTIKLPKEKGPPVLAA